MTKDRAEYIARFEAVRLGAPACNARGPNHADCILEPDHDGTHEGNGFDEWGEMYQCWDTPERRRKAAS